MRIGTVEIPGRVFLAPLAAYTSWPFRRICRRLGAALTTTEVVKARELVRGIEATFQIIQFKADEHPIAAQILSTDPGVAREAAAILSEAGFDLVDLNCGCPKRRVMSDGMGAELMGSPEKVEAIIAGMCEGASVPVTVKIRAGRWHDRPTAVEVAQRAEAAGAAAVCVHPRFAQQGSQRPPDWRLIADVRAAVTVPVIGNGAIHTPADAVRMFDETGCDAVAIGQAAMGRPWIFRQTETLVSTGAEPPPRLSTRSWTSFSNITAASSNTTASTGAPS